MLGKTVCTKFLSKEACEGSKDYFIYLFIFKSKCKLKLK